MAEMWVDPGGLGETARTVSAIADRIAAAGAGADSSATGVALPGARVGRACGVGSVAVTDVLSVVGARLHDWSARTTRAADDYARVDAAGAASISEVVAGLWTSDVLR
ncbi:Excreted virulence factor EspC (Type VII ESX diderm) [Prescottella defluvii]|uniref:hypothetical protein n=1 Tax=Prescottella defluvii TaxID=1323361 RepID=UPI0039EA6B70